MPPKLTVAVAIAAPSAEPVGCTVAMPAPPINCQTDRDALAMNAQEHPKPAPIRPAKERIGWFTEPRAAQGYVAEFFRCADGTYITADSHCPVCAVAVDCQGSCRDEPAMLVHVLALGRVNRGDHVLQDA